MMQIIRSTFKKLLNIHKYSKVAIKLGLTMMFFFYILAIVALWMSRDTEKYMYLMSVYRGCLEAAPACLAVGVCAGLLGDLMLRSNKNDNDSTDNDRP